MYAVTAEHIRELPARFGSTRLVAVDGPSGSGKTVFAGRLAAELGAPVVHTDDFLEGWEDQFTFWARLEEQVLGPLRAGRSARFERRAWGRRDGPGESVTVEPDEVVLLEGVSSARRVIRAELSFAVFVTAPAELCAERAVARDGDDSLAFRAYLERWRLAEDRHFAEDQTESSADLRVNGAADPPDDRYEALSWRLSCENGVDDDDRG
jgi:uridine kinase